MSAQISPCLSGWRRHTIDALVSNDGTYNFWTFEVVPCIQSRASPSAHKNKNKDKNKKMHAVSCRTETYTLCMASSACGPRDLQTAKYVVRLLRPIITC
jgi:chemotaxis methyl-accepting protein methylase